MRVRSLSRKLALALPLNVAMALLVFGATPLVLTCAVLCGLAGAWMAYAFEAAFDGPVPAAEPRHSQEDARQPQGVPFQHRHA
jgi:hypothetical protein